MAKRNSLEIMAEILSLCRQPQAKTGVMHRANLSWRILNDYVCQLESMGFLEIVHHSSAKYVTTRNGLKFLEKWRTLVELLQVDENQARSTSLRR
jgi:predicted transcriptional regulator